MRLIALRNVGDSSNPRTAWVEQRLTSEPERSPQQKLCRKAMPLVLCFVGKLQTLALCISNVILLRGVALILRDF